MNHRKILRKMRLDRNLTQGQVAQNSHGFLTQVMVQAVEQGKIMPNLSHLIGFCHAFNTTLVSLFIAMDIPETPDDLDKQFHEIYRQRKIRRERNYNGFRSD